MKFLFYTSSLLLLLTINSQSLLSQTRAIDETTALQTIVQNEREEKIYNLTTPVNDVNKLQSYTGKISGILTDEDSKKPIGFATIGLYSNGLLVATTDSDIDGFYSLYNIQPGFYHLETVLVGYQIRVLEETKITIGNVSINMSLKTIPPHTPSYFNNCFVEKFDLSLLRNEIQSNETEMKIEYQGSSSVMIDPLPIESADSNNSSITITERGEPSPQARDPREGEKEIELRIYPNPTADILKIELNQDADKIILISDIGQVLQEYKAIKKGTLEIYLSKFSPGLYFIQLYIGDKMHTEQIVVISSK